MHSRTPDVTMIAKDASRIRLFVSHSSRDGDLVKAVIQLFRSALNLPAEHIRCTTVSGYKLSPGDEIQSKLKTELLEAKAFIGIITPNSIKSAFVLFELGARWGHNLHWVPVVGAGVKASELHGPFSSIHAPSIESRQDMIQLIEKISELLETPLSSQSVFDEDISNLITLSEKLKGAALSPSRKLKSILKDIVDLEDEIEMIRVYSERSPSEEE